MPENTQLIVYTLEFCPNCELLKGFLKKNGHTYAERDLSTAESLTELRVNGVFPGGVATEIFQGLPEAMRQSEEARFAAQPLPRIGQPDEVAQAYLYLMKCGYVTGQILQVDGGGLLAG